MQYRVSTSPEYREKDEKKALCRGQGNQSFGPMRWKIVHRQTPVPPPSTFQYDATSLLIAPGDMYEYLIIIEKRSTAYRDRARILNDSLVAFNTVYSQQDTPRSSAEDGALIIVARRSQCGRRQHIRALRTASISADKGVGYRVYYG